MTTRKLKSELLTVGLFPLPNASLLPCQLMPLHVFEPRYRALVADVLANQGLIAIPRLKPGFEEDYHGKPAVFEQCGVGRIVEHESLEDGRYNVLVRGCARVLLSEELDSHPYRVARAVEVPARDSCHPAALSALRTEVIRLSQELLPQLVGAERALANAAFEAGREDEQRPFLAALFTDDPAERQDLLEEHDSRALLVRLLAVLKRYSARHRCAERGVSSTLN